MINIWAGDVTQEQLKTHPWGATLEYIMINRWTHDLRRILSTIASNIRLFYLAGQNQFVLCLYTYIENIYTNETPIEELARIAGEEISPQAEEDFMTIGQRLREEGRLEGKKETAKKMLAEGVDVKFIAKVTGLTLEQISHLKS